MENKNLKSTDFAEVSLACCRALILELTTLDKDCDQAQISAMYMTLLDSVSDMKKSLDKLDEQTQEQFIKDNIIELKRISLILKRYEKFAEEYYFFNN